MSRKEFKITAVLFDLDDTLIDWSQKELPDAEISRRSINLIHDHLSTVATHALPGKDAFFELYRQSVIAAWGEAKKTWTAVNFQQIISNCLAEIGIMPEQVNINALLRVYDWQPMPGVRPFPDAHTVLQTLKKRGYKIGLITNAMQPMWMRDIELAAYGLLQYLDARTTSGDAGYIKPHPEIYRQVLAELQTEPQQALFVGDRPENDILGANKTGMLSVLISPPHLNRELNGVQPHFTITRLSELLPILEQLEASGG